jgi:hypothetical protein
VLSASNRTDSYDNDEGKPTTDIGSISRVKEIPYNNVSDFNDASLAGRNIYKYNHLFYSKDCELYNSN